MSPWNGRHARCEIKHGERKDNPRRHDELDIYTYTRTRRLAFVFILSVLHYILAFFFHFMYNTAFEADLPPSTGKGTYTESEIRRTLPLTGWPHGICSQPL